MLAFATRRNRKHTTRKLLGGKYTGQGTNACGFAPALRGEGETVRNFGIFTKLMLEEEAEKERRKAPIVQPVDPTMKYILYPVKICKVNKSLIGPDNPENDVDSCDLANYPDDLDDARAVQYIDGGIDLEKFVVEAYKVLPVFESLKNLFKGLSVLHKGGVSHNDIKPGNIVLKEENNGTFTARYIDIGFVHRMKDGINFTDELPFEANYYPWPYEMRFSVAPIRAPTEKSVKDWYGAYSHSMFKYIPFEHLYNSDGSKKFTLATAQTLLDAFTRKAESMIPAIPAGDPQLQKKTRERNRDILKTISELVLSKVDTYSLGNVLMYIYNRFICHSLYKGKIEFFIARTKSYHDVNTLEAQGIPEASRKWHQEVANKISKPYLELCLMMMDLDPSKRRPLPICAHIYKGIVAKMKDLFTKEQIQLHVMQWK